MTALNLNDRAKLKEHLDMLLTGLRKRYFYNQHRRFPSNTELVKLTEVIFVLAKVVGTKKSDFGDLLGAVKRVENRFSKITITGFADQLRERLCRLPRCPASVLHHAQIPTATKEALVRFLDSGELNAQPASWENMFAAIRELDFPASTLTADEAAKLLEAAGNSKQRQHIARLLLTDLRRQQLEWDLHYGDHITASLQWLYLLQRPEDYAQLRQVYCGTALAPDANAKHLAQMANAQRQKRHRNKRAVVKK